MGGPIVLGAAAAVGAAAWAVRGRSSALFGPFVWRGPKHVRAVALTFDDGPSKQTANILDLLARQNVPATFFMCGANVRRHPSIARDVALAGHEIGNHTENHARLWLRSGSFVRAEIGEAQRTICGITSHTPRLFRAPYGVRWFGLGDVLREFHLTGVMWTVIGRDWALPFDRIAARLESGARNGAILCLHDGRELESTPDISATVAATTEIVPRLLDAGYEFRTVSDLMGYSKPVCGMRSSSG